MNSIKTIRSISRTYRHVKRYRQIFNILVKNGFGMLFRDMELYKPFRLPWEKSPRNVVSLENIGAARLRNVLVELGPTFVKLGQFLSCRPDILPREIIEALSTLRDKVPPFQFEEVRNIIRNELNGEIEDIFNDFSDIPAGSASIAQGYSAHTKDGTRVFVKVQRPNIIRTVKIDLEIMSYLALHLEKNVEEVAFFHPTKLVNVFGDSLLKELDFHNEATNMTLFAKQFSGEESLVVPQPIQELCTEKVLTMTFIDGIPITGSESLTRAGIDPNIIGELGVKLLLAQFFDFGFFHGDPHPGNMMALPGSKIAYLDFGVMERLTQFERLALSRLAMTMYTEDTKEMVKVLLTMSDFPEIADRDGLERDLSAIVAGHLHGSLKDLDMIKFTRDFYDMCFKRKLSLRPHFYSMIRALTYADSMGRSIVPDFNIFAQLRPFVLKQSLEKLNPVIKLKNLSTLIEEWNELAKTIPETSISILKQLKDGRLALNHKMDDVKELSVIMNNSLRNLSAGLVVSSSIIASSLMLLARVPPLAFDISILGLATFIISASIGLLMLIKNAK